MKVLFEPGDLKHLTTVDELEPFNDINNEGTHVNRLFSRIYFDNVEGS